MAPGRKEDIDQKNLINIAEKKYETFLRKQILDHSSNDKCYIPDCPGQPGSLCWGWNGACCDSHAQTIPELL